MTSRFISPFYDVGSGIKPSSGSKLSFFKTDGVTPKDTFSDKAGTIPNPNPVIADSFGVFGDIYISGDYKVTLKDKNDSLKFSLAEVSEVSTGNFDSNLINDLSQAYTFKTIALMKSSLIIFPVGKKIFWQGYYAESDGGSNWGVVKSGAHTDDGGSIFTLDDGKYAQANLKGKMLSVKKFGTKSDDSFDDTSAAQAAATYVQNDATGRLGLSFGGSGFYRISQLNTRFSERTIDMTGAVLRPTVENQFMWEHHGQLTDWIGGKIEPSGATTTTEYWGIRVSNDATTNQSGENSFEKTYFTSCARSLEFFMDNSFGACYRHTLFKVRTVGLNDTLAGSFGVAFKGNFANDSSGNDSKMISCAIRNSLYNIYSQNNLGLKLVGTYSDGGANGVWMEGGSHLDITSCYLENNLVGLKRVAGAAAVKILGGSFSNTVNLEGVSATSEKDTIAGCVNLNETSPAIEVTPVGVLTLGWVGGTTIGESDGSLENIEGLKARHDGTNTLASSTKGDLILSGEGGAVGVSVNGNGEMSLASARTLTGGVELEVLTVLRSASLYAGSYILDEDPTFSLITHTGGVRYKLALGTVV